MLLLLPGAARLGGGGIGVVMLGATYTHLFRVVGEPGPAVFTAGLLLLTGAALHLRRG